MESKTYEQRLQSLENIGLKPQTLLELSRAATRAGQHSVIITATDLAVIAPVVAAIDNSANVAPVTTS